MSSRFEVSGEPAYSSSYNWRSSTKLKLDEPEEISTAKQYVAKREMYDSSHAKSPVSFSHSNPLTRSVDLFSSSVGYDLTSNGIERQSGRARSPGFTSTGNHANVPTQSLSRAETPSGNRKSNNELTRSVDLGSHASLQSSSYDYQTSRPKTSVARKGDDRVKSRPPVAPGRPRPQPSDTLPRSGTPAAYDTAHSRTAANERSSSSSNNKRALHSSINSLDNLRYADQQQLYDKHSTVRTSSTNFHSGRPGSRSSDVGPFTHVQPGSSLGTPGERHPSSNAHKSLLSESRPKSALAGSLTVLERSGTPVNVRSYAGTPDFQTRDKSSSLRHSTDMNLGASYDEIIKRLRNMETQTSSGNLRTRPELATDRKAQESESLTRHSSAYVTSNLFKKKPTDEYSTKIASDEFSDIDDLKYSSVYDRNSARTKDNFQYKDGGKPRITGNAKEVSDKSKTYLDLSNRTGERMSAYSKDGAIESWLRSVTHESSDLFTEQLHGDKTAFQDSNFNGGDHLDYNESAKQKRTLKSFETSNGYDEKARNERLRELSIDSYQRATSPIQQSVAKKGSTVFTDSIYNVDKPTHATRRDFEPDLSLAKQERGRTDVSSYDPNTRSDSRLSLLRKYLDQADCIGTQTVSSAVDYGFLKLPDELGMDDLCRSSSALDHRSSTRDTSHLNGSTSRKMSADLSYLGNAPKPVYATTALNRTPSKEAFNHKDLYSGIPLSRDKPDSYQKTSNGPSHEDPTLRSERNLQDLNGYRFNALTSSVERPRSPTRSVGETFTEKRYDKTAHKSEQTGLELETENELERKDNDYKTTSIYYDKKPSYSSIGKDWVSRSYGASALEDTGKADEKKKHDVSGFQLTGGYADSRTLLSILENNRKYKTASTADLHQKPEAKYSIRSTAELAKLSDNVNSGVDTTTNFFSRSTKDQTPIEKEPGQVRSVSDFSSLGPPKRVWYSEEHLAPSTSDADNDISVRFDYRPDTYRYVLRKNAVDSAEDRLPLSNGVHERSNGVQERSAEAVGVRKWRSDLALFGDKLESKDPLATTFDSRSVLRSSSFRGTKEAKTPERRQVKWQDEILFEKESGGSSIAMNGNATLQSYMLGRKESSVSPSSVFVTPSFERLQTTERTSINEDSKGLAESRSLYQSLRSQPSSHSISNSHHETPSNYRQLSSSHEIPRSQSPSSKSFLASKWSTSGRDEDLETKLKQTVNGDSNPTSIHETSSNYRPSSSLYESLRSPSPSSKSFLDSAWSASGRVEDRESKMKQLVSGDSNSTSLHESSSNYRPSSSLYKSLRSEPSSSKSFLASTLSGSGRDEDRETKLKQTTSGDPNQNSLHETPTNYRQSSSLYENLRSQSPSSKSFLASAWSPSGRDKDRETRLKQTVNGDSNPTSIHETSANYRPTSSLYESLRTEPQSSKSFLASTWSPSGRDEDRETRLKQTVNGDLNEPTSLHETPSNYRPTYRPSSRLSSTSYTYSDKEPFTTKATNIALHDDDSVTSTTNLSKPPPNDHSTYKRYTPSDDKTSTYLSTDSVYKSSYSPTRYTSTALHIPPDTHNDNLTGTYNTAPNSVLKTERASSPYSSQEIADFLSSRSANKTTYDSNQTDGVLQGKWRPVTSNGVSSSSVSDSYRHLLSSSIYPDSTQKDSSHLTPASLLDSSAKEMSSIRGSFSLSKPHRSDDLSIPLNVATNYPHDTSHLTSSLLSSTDISAKDNSTSGLPYKYLSYANHVDPSSNCSSTNTYGQSSTPLSDPYSGRIGHHVGLASSRSSSRDDLRHPRSDSMTNGFSTGTDFLSGAADKHDDGMSLVSETEFVVMRSGDIVKRPFKKSDRSDAHTKSRYSKPQGAARNLLR